MALITKRYVYVRQDGVLNLTGRVTVNPDGQSLTINFPNCYSFTVSTSYLMKVLLSELVSCVHDLTIHQSFTLSLRLKAYFFANLSRPTLLVPFRLSSRMVDLSISRFITFVYFWPPNVLGAAFARAMSVRPSLCHTRGSRVNGARY